MKDFTLTMTEDEIIKILSEAKEADALGEPNNEEEGEVNIID